MSIAPTARVTIEEGVVFGQGGGRDLRCDVFAPPGGAERAPAVLLVHGGGWRQGDRTQMRGYGILIGRLGFVCVASEYRLTPEAPWPAQVHDVKAALRWMRANAATLGLDPDRIAISGNSAGGHLSLFAAGTQDDPAWEGEGGNAGAGTRVAASIAFYPPVSFVKPDGSLGGFASVLLGENPSVEAARAAAPETYLSPAFPPTLLIHGTSDELVPVGESSLVFDRLSRAGVPAEMHLYAGQPHGFDAAPAFGRQSAEVMALFLRRYVGDPAAAGV